MSVARVRSLSTIVARVRQEFLDMPGLRLTEPQVRRLWTLGDAECRAVLDHLVSRGFLVGMPDGSFLRVDLAKPVKVSHPRRANARTVAS